MGENDELNVQKVIREIVEKDGPALAQKWGEELRADRAKVREAADQAEVDTEVITKKCTKCGEEKSLDAYYAQKQCKYGKAAQCKVCLRKYREENKERIAAEKRKYYEENKERIAAEKHKYYRKNKERIAAQKRKYYEENKERITETAQKYRQENKERIAEWMSKYHQENKERLNVRSRKYRQENKEPLAEYSRKYHQENKDRRNAYSSRYAKENPEVYRRAKRKRRAFKRNLPHAPLTPAQYERLYEFRDQVFGEVTS